MSDPIKHVVVLMLENRSFDHMLGSLQGAIQHLEGIDTTEKPPVCFNDCHTNARRYYQYPNQEYCLDPSPSHEHKDVMLQIDNDKMDGFVNNYSSVAGSSEANYPDIMGYYPQDFLPVMHTLAKSFLVCDHWFASLPGPTWPNRFFVHSGTCNGHVTMPQSAFHPDLPSCNQPQDTIYNRLEEQSVSWKIYHNGLIQCLVLKKLWDHLDHFHDMEVFLSDAKGPEASFPSYSFIEPCYRGPKEDDQHPPADVRNGEALMATVYNAIRTNDDLWRSTLLIVVYDEHGGFYDHVPPLSAVPPDDFTDEYDFKKYGVRVPAILISPWLKAGTVSSTIYDHTSILKYAIDKWSLNPLTKRVDAAKTFADLLLILPSPRTDAPAAFEVPPIYPTPQSESVASHEHALLSFARYLDVSLPHEGADQDRYIKRMTDEFNSLEDKVRIAEERFRLFLTQNTL